MKKLVVALAFSLASVTVIAACGSDSSTSSSSSSGSSGTSGGTTTNSISISSNKFTPATLTIKAGDTVTWTWAGGTHNVASGANCTKDNAYTSGAPDGTVGKTFQHKFDTAGSFEFFCEPHCATSQMKGTVVVQ